MEKKEPDLELDGAEIFSNWSQLVQETGSSPSESTDVLDMALDSLSVEGGDRHWLTLFQKTNLSDMDLVALQKLPNYDRDLASECQQIKNQKAAFLLELVRTHADDLRVAGLSDEQIDRLKEGKLPVNWTVHLKYPLAYGGTITVDNFEFIPQHPFHEDLHHFINQQITTEAGVISPAVLYVPVPKASVYVPYGASDMAKEVMHFKQGGTK